MLLWAVGMTGQSELLQLGWSNWDFARVTTLVWRAREHDRGILVSEEIVLYLSACGVQLNLRQAETIPKQAVATAATKNRKMRLVLNFKEHITKREDMLITSPTSVLYVLQPRGKKETPTPYNKKLILYTWKPIKQLWWDTDQNSGSDHLSQRLLILQDWGQEPCLLTIETPR